MDISDIEKLVDGLSDDIGVEVDDVIVYTHSLRQQTVIRIIKHIKGEKYAHEITIPDNVLANPSASTEVTLKRHITEGLRGFQGKYQETHTVNGHHLVFEDTGESFTATDEATDRAWEIEVEDPTVFTDPDDGVRAMAMVDHRPSELDSALSTRLRMYLIGWALENDPAEVRDHITKVLRCA